MPSREAVVARSASALESAEQRAARQVAAAYNQARQELMARLLDGWTATGVLAPDDAARFLRQSGLLQQVDTRLQQLERELGITLRGIVSAGADRALDSIQRELALLPPALTKDVDPAFGTINERVIEQFVPVAMSDWRGLTMAMSGNLQRELQVGLIQGEAYPNLVRRLLSQSPGEGAVFPRAQTSAELATRRLVVAAENGAKQQAIGQVAKSIPEIRKQALAAIGKNTTDCCLRVHGQIQPVDAPFELVGEPRFADLLMTSPFHWNCRTGIVMHHPAFEESMPTSKLKSAAQRELEKRRKEGEGQRRGDTRTAPPPPPIATVRGPEPAPVAASAFDRNDAAQVRQRVVETGTQYNTQIKAAEAESWRMQNEIVVVSGNIERLEKNAVKRAGTPEGDRIAEKLIERRRERDALTQKLDATKAEINRLAVEGNRRIAELVQVGDPAGATLRVFSPQDPATMRHWQGGVDEFNKLVSRTVAPAKVVAFVGMDANGRAHYLPDTQAVYLPTDAPTRVAVHELGHWLEDMNPDVHRKALAFFDRRTAGEAATPIYAHAPDELGKRDKFLSPYMGKIYVDGGDRFATEIVSVGIEYLHQRTVELASKDPDYFDFIFNLVRGR